MSLKRKRILINLFITLILISGTTVAILYARGYRSNLSNGQIKGTGLLSLISYPKSAQVFINNRLTTVTDDRLNLAPGNYEVKIAKQGFHPWTKSIPIKAEAVSETSARLFPVIPATTPLTFYQVTQAVLSPDASHLAFVLDNSPIPQDNGLYTLSLNSNILNNNQITQIADNTVANFKNGQILWSPDNSQILCLFTENVTLGKQTSPRISSAYLLNTKGMNSGKEFTDVTVRLPLILSQWQSQFAKLDQSAFSLIEPEILDILTKKSINVYFSPDKEKVLYSPLLDLDLPANTLAEKLPNYNSTPENRSLKAGSIYVLDLKEGTNYLISSGQNIGTDQKVLISQTTARKTFELATSSAKEITSLPLDTNPLGQFQKLRLQTDPGTTTNLRWFADSKHLLLLKADGVDIIDYDNLNPINLLSSTVAGNVAVASSDGNHIITLTNLNQKPDTFNLISLDLK